MAGPPIATNSPSACRVELCEGYVDVQGHARPYICSPWRCSTPLSIITCITCTAQHLLSRAWFMVHILQPTKKNWLAWDAQGGRCHNTLLVCIQLETRAHKRSKSLGSHSAGTLCRWKIRAVIRILALPHQLAVDNSGQSSTAAQQPLYHHTHTQGPVSPALLPLNPAVEPLFPASI